MTSFPPALLAGYRAFRSGTLAQVSERYRALAESGQRPETLIVACCDSRLIPCGFDRYKIGSP